MYDLYDYVSSFLSGFMFTYSLKSFDKQIRSEYKMKIPYRDTLLKSIYIKWNFKDRKNIIECERLNRLRKTLINIKDNYG